MIPAAPARFSTTTDCPSRAASLSAMMRLVMSVVPPGAAGTMMVMGRSGQAAETEADAHSRTPAAAAAQRIDGMLVSCRWCGAASGRCRAASLWR